VMGASLATPIISAQPGWQIASSALRIADANSRTRIVAEIELS
jgi:hypothetical protein